MTHGTDALEPLERDVEMPTESWNVYFLSIVDPARPQQDFGRVKVGITKNDVVWRIAQLQTGNPYQIRCEGAFATRVAREVEHWIHRTNASRLVHLEWLRLTRPEIPDLVRAAREEEKRLAHIAEANARWSQSRSNRKERSASAEERRLHEGVRDVRSQLYPIELQLRHTVANIALQAGAVLRIPGVLRVDRIPPSRSFSQSMVLEKFPSLAAQHTVDRTKGKFYWQNIPRLDTPEWINLRDDVKRLEEQKDRLEGSILHDASELRDEGERTEHLACLHEQFLILTQLKARLKLDEEDLQGQMIQSMEDFEKISDVCSFRRSSKPTLNRGSFCEANPTEAAACSLERAAYIRWTIYASRSY